MSKARSQSASTQGNVYVPTHVLKLDSTKACQKRATSPLHSSSTKKIKADQDSLLMNQSTGICKESTSRTNVEVFQKILAKQVELVEKLVFKDVECQKLKKKFDQVDRNCGRWHEFAIHLQSRVKRLELVLHRQQDLIKSLGRSKDDHTTNASVQTDNSLFSPAMTSNPKATLSKNGHVKKENGSNIIANTVKMKYENISASSPAVVIDLTDETAKSTYTIKSIAPKPCANGHSSNKKDPRFMGRHDSSHMNLITSSCGNGANAVLSQGHQNVPYTNAFLVISDPGKKPTATIQANTTGLNSVLKPVPKVNTVLPLNNAKYLQQMQQARISNKDHTVGDPQVLVQKNGISLKNSNQVSGRYNNNALPYPPLPPIPPPPSNVPKQVFAGPSQPLLKIKKSKDGIELSWNEPNPSILRAKMESYELFVYQHNPNSSAVNRWKRIGNERIKAMPLPMACTLSQFTSGSLYYFAVRGRDIHGRYGAFSAPCCSSEVQH